MTDLNDWQLAYPGTTLTFGPGSTDYPLSVQVGVSDTAVENRDREHNQADGLLGMGTDLLRGNELVFTLTTLPDPAFPAKPWVPALDRMGTFRAAWRADSIRKKPYRYATLSNLDRGRMVIGRPRRFGQVNTDRLRRGVLKYVAGFTTVGPDFYSTTEQTLTLAPATDVPGGNGGDVPTWGTFVLTGPFTAGTLIIKQGATVLCTFTIPGPILAGQTVTVNTQPWSRYVLLNSAAGSGLVRTDPLGQAEIPVGAFTVRWTRTDGTNTSSAQFKFRNAYSSL